MKWLWNSVSLPQFPPLPLFLSMPLLRAHTHTHAHFLHCLDARLMCNPLSAFYHCKFSNWSFSAAPFQNLSPPLTSIAFHPSPSPGSPLNPSSTTPTTPPPPPPPPPHFPHLFHTYTWSKYYTHEHTDLTVIPTTNKGLMSSSITIAQGLILWAEPADSYRPSFSSLEELLSPSEVRQIHTGSSFLL